MLYLQGICFGEKLKKMKNIGIIGAIDEEIELIVNEMKCNEIIKKAGMIYYVGELCDRSVVIVKCGIGKVNAAVCTQIMIDFFQVDVVINTGVAGSLKNEINIGDIVISVDAVNHDFDTTAVGDDYGVIARMEESFFKADDYLIRLAEQSCKKANPQISVFKGRILTGDQFISSHEKKEWLINTFHGLCVEMEGAAIGQTAYLNEKPFVIIRAISDKGDGSAEMDYNTFKEMAIINLSRAVKELLNNCA